MCFTHPTYYEELSVISVFVFCSVFPPTCPWYCGAMRTKPKLNQRLPWAHQRPMSFERRLHTAGCTDQHYPHFVMSLLMMAEIEQACTIVTESVWISARWLFAWADGRPENQLHQASHTDQASYQIGLHTANDRTQHTLHFQKNDMSQNKIL